MSVHKKVGLPNPFSARYVSVPNFNLQANKFDLHNPP